MRIIKVTNGPLMQNCYILAGKDKAIVIDPGIDTKKIIDTLNKNRLKPTVVLLTHGHFDHIYSAKELKNMGARVYVTEVDAPKLLDNELNMGFICDIICKPVLPDGFLIEGENEFEGEKFDIVFTPGHTSGSCVIFYGENAFTGDTYFEEGVYGRTDLLDGNQEKIEASLKKLKPLLKGKTIFPGHE